MSAVHHLCLVGKGVDGSPSPAMHRAALAACELAGTYVLEDVEHDRLEGVVVALRDGRYTGCNVTIPYKRLMADRCDELRADAELLRAVNTITVQSQALAGCNTDCEGFTRAMDVLDMWPSQHERAVVLGAGGAAAAVLLALVRAGWKTVHVVARRQEAVHRMAHLGPAGAVHGVAWRQRDDVHAALTGANLLVNATPCSTAELPLSVEWLPQGCHVADLRYRPRPVDLVSAAQARRLRAADGSEMLLQQAMLSFTFWTGRDAPEGAMRAAMEAELSP